MRFTQYKQPPCNGCNRRKVGCHAKCGDYNEWLTGYREDAERARKYDNAQDFIVSNRMDWASKVQKGIGRGIKVRNVWGR